jgi:hypothetical protein
MFGFELLLGALYRSTIVPRLWSATRKRRLQRETHRHERAHLSFDFGIPV